MCAVYKLKILSNSFEATSLPSFPFYFFLHSPFIFFFMSPPGILPFTDLSKYSKKKKVTFLSNFYSTHTQNLLLTSPKSQAVRKPNRTASLASRSNQGTPMAQRSHSSLFQRSRDQAVKPTSIRTTYGLPSISHRPK